MDEFQLEKQKKEKLLEAANQEIESLLKVEADLRKAMEEHIEMALKEKSKRQSLENEIKVRTVTLLILLTSRARQMLAAWLPVDHPNLSFES